jgi:hypothetical protein
MVADPVFKDRATVTIPLCRIAWPRLAGRFGLGFHGLSSPVEQLADKVLGSHAACSCHGKGMATRSLGSPHGSFQDLLKLAPLVSKFLKRGLSFRV